MSEPLFGQKEAEAVLEQVRPYAEAIIASDPKPDPKGLVVLLFNPGLEIDPGWTLEEVTCKVLASITMGEPSEDCYGYAVQKALMTFRTGLPSHLAAIARPDLLDAGDCIWAGAGIYEGCVAASSGISGYNDFAASMAACTRAHTLLLARVLATQKAGKGFVE